MKLEIEQKYQDMIINQSPPREKISKKSVKKCKKLISILEGFSPDEAARHQQCLEYILEEKQELEIKEEPSNYICEEHLNDYMKLLIDSEYLTKRKLDWQEYN